MSDELFKVKSLFNIRQFLAPDEKVTCLDGSLNSFTIGTSSGRILFLQPRNDTVVLDSVVQVAISNLPVSHLVHASAFNYVLALISTKIYLVEKESQKVHCASISNDVVAFSLNTNPTVDSPFVLQFAVSTSDKQIITYKLQDKDLVVENKFHVESNVLCLYYSRRCICFATLNSYFVHDLTSNTTRNLFPYDIATTQPIIINVDVDEFLLNGMQGLGVFATVSGVSSRPPIVWGSEKIISFVSRSNNIFVLNTSSIIVFDCLNGIEEVQRIRVSNGTSLYNLDGQIVFCESDLLSLLQEIDWFERAELLLSSNKIEEALRITHDAISRSGDDATYLRMNIVKEKAAMKYFFASRFDKCRELIDESGMDPRKLIIYHQKLLPLPSGFVLLDQETNGNTSLDEKHLEFLENYLMDVRGQNWDENLGRDIDAIILRLMALRGKSFDCDFCCKLRCFYEDSQIWLRKHEFIEYSLLLPICLGRFEEALKVGRDTLDGIYLNKELIKCYVESLGRISNDKLALETLEFLIKLDAESVLEHGPEQLLKNFRLRILILLEHEPVKLIAFLEKWQHLKESELDTKLIKLYIQEIIRPLSDTTSEENIMSYRNRLRKILLESVVYSRDEILKELQEHHIFLVECVLVNAKEENQTEKCLEKLLRDFKDFDAAEILCSHLSTDHSSLYRILLKFYMRAASEHPEFKSRITNLLSTMTATTTADFIETLREVPDKWLFKRLGVYTEKVFLNTKTRHMSNCLKDAILSVSTRQLARKAAERSAKAVTIDEQTSCYVCGKQLGPDDASFNFKSKLFAHIDCR